MIRTVVLCLLAASSALAFPHPDAAAADQPAGGVPVSQSGGCPGGYVEGSEVQQGRISSVCRGGSIVPTACITEELGKINPGQTFDKGQTRMVCKQSGSELTYEPSGCVLNGKEHKVGETFDEGDTFYICQTGEGTNLKITTQGCVDGGKRVNFGEKVAKDQNQFTCTKSVNDAAKLVPSGCFKDGKQYEPGQTFEVDKIVYNCSKYGREKVVAKPSGCVAGGKKLNDGDRYTENDVIYECNVENEKVSTRAVACSTGGIERKLGCTWSEGQAPQQFEFQCLHDPAANTAKVVQIRCNYNFGGGVAQIEPGCFRVFDKAAYACSKEGETLKYQSFQGDKPETAASGAGFKAC